MTIARVFVGRNKLPRSGHEMVLGASMALFGYYTLANTNNSDTKRI